MKHVPAKIFADGKAMSAKAASVAAWKDAMLRLSDKHFFYLMRLYLGQIKTPFSKQRLVDELADFLRNPEIRANILACLDAFDLRLIAGVLFLSEPDRKKLVRLFANEYKFPELYNRILNLEERLLIFRAGEDSEAGYRVNPYLEEDLRRLTDFSLLVSPVSSGCAGGTDFPAFRASVPLAAADLPAAAVFCFFARYKPEEKIGSGLLKKRDQELFARVFSGFPCSADTLAAALKKLSLLKTFDGKLEPDLAVWREFASLSALERTVWLCAALCEQSSLPAALAEKAAAFSQLVSVAGRGCAYTREDLERLLLVLEDRADRFPVAGTGFAFRGGAGGNFPGRSRFASIVASSGLAAAVPELDAALSFGLLVREGERFLLNEALFPGQLAPQETGRDASPEHARKSPESPEAEESLETAENPESAESASEAPQFLFVSSAFEVTVLQGGTLANLLPVMVFLEPEQIQSAGIFRITRKACAPAFSAGESAQSAVAAFSALGVTLPENVRFSLADWYASVSSACLYSGFVLKAEKRVLPFFAEGGNLRRLVRHEIAPGVFLLNVQSEDALEASMAAEGLDFLSFANISRTKASAARTKRVSAVSASSGAGGTGAKPVFLADLPDTQGADAGLFARRAESADNGECAGDAAAEATGAGQARAISYLDLKKKLLARLAAMDAPESAKNVFESRIEAKTLVSETQLDCSAVRFEKNEANALDFSGKLRLVEQAYKTGEILEIVTDEKSRTGAETFLVKADVSGNPGAAGRGKNSAVRAATLFGTLVPTGTPCAFSIARASSVRLIPGSIFSDSENEED